MQIMAKQSIQYSSHVLDFRTVAKHANMWGSAVANNDYSLITAEMQVLESFLSVNDIMFSS